MMSNKALALLRQKLQNAYYDRLTKGPKDYPPYALMSWDDRAKYHAFILKLIDETEKELGA